MKRVWIQVLENVFMPITQQGGVYICAVHQYTITHLEYFKHYLKLQNLLEAIYLNYLKHVNELMYTYVINYLKVCMYIHAGQYFTKPINIYSKATLTYYMYMHAHEGSMNYIPIKGAIISFDIIKGMYIHMRLNFMAIYHIYMNRVLDFTIIQAINILITKTNILYYPIHYLIYKELS